ncbi:MAG: hypothetical protein A2951_02990 [Candidatus Buchananbacteria bacterium RIFCSPLOWO2_01_FULL_56_15]|uniref:Gcp-like domain-containing protein n=1 Tax=Candidatus Buchananbacteria bacterium RIFCSPLOWO2_01_FULL_56_15 TaxID=1797547 RepID=A0A1G1YSK2_9BACT|nr:MAG: hypothetical protein A2951_02990 [Candidatus Buchananbacteria bacterium RIFCSPLOWO2_01_FULL_56_15]
MVLFIDTTDGVTVFLALIDRRGRCAATKRLRAQYRQAQRLLPAIDALRRTTKLPLSGLTGVMLVSGPGPFTALRVGVLTANTIAWVLRLPLVGVRKTVGANFETLIAQGLAKLKNISAPVMVEPYYGQAPNVTTRRKRLGIRK